MLKNIVVTLLVVLGSVLAWYLAVYYQKSTQVCMAVITPARSVITGQCRYFSDPCHVPPVFYTEDDACASDLVLPQ